MNTFHLHFNFWPIDQLKYSAQRLNFPWKFSCLVTYDFPTLWVAVDFRDLAEPFGFYISTLSSMAMPRKNWKGSVRSPYDNYQISFILTILALGSICERPFDKIIQVSCSKQGLLNCRILAPYAIGCTKLPLHQHVCYIKSSLNHFWTNLFSKWISIFHCFSRKISYPWIILVS